MKTSATLASCSVFLAERELVATLVAAAVAGGAGVWLARWPGVSPEKKTEDWEEGLYQYFDVKVWKKIPGWFRLNYEQLADKSVE